MSPVTLLSYIEIRHSPQAYRGHVERVGDEVHHVPEVAGVLLQPHVPQLLDLAPDEASHPGEDAEFHWGGEGAALERKNVQFLILRLRDLSV